MTKRKNPNELLSPRYRLSKEETDMLYDMYLSEMSILDISKETNIGSYAITKAFEKYGYKIRTKKEAYEVARKQGKIGGSRGKLDKANNWKGGRIIDTHGYIHLKIPDHPRATANGYVREHLVIWEEHHKKELPKGWHIHHINGNKSDNRPENLLALSSRKHSLIIPELSKRIGELEQELLEIKNELKQYKK